MAAGFLFKSGCLRSPFPQHHPPLPLLFPKVSPSLSLRPLNPFPFYLIPYPVSFPFSCPPLGSYRPGAFAPSAASAGWLAVSHAISAILACSKVTTAA